MNLIRDGGFGRGDLTFWEAVGDGTLSISDVTPMHGLYCALLEIAMGDHLTALARDYIPVLFGQIIIANFYAKSDGAGYIYTRYYEYDGDLNLINTTDKPGGMNPLAYTQFQSMLNPLPNTEYVRIGMHAYADEGPVNAKVDSCYASVLSGDDPVTYRLEIASKTGIVSSGNTSGTPMDMLGFTTYTAEIDCTVLTGTVPKLDVTVVELDMYGNEVLLGTFAQLDAAGHERIALDAPIGDGMYVKYVETGTWTNATFDVLVTGVR